MERYFIAPDDILDENGGVIFHKGQRTRVDEGEEGRAEQLEKMGLVDEQQMPVQEPGALDVVNTIVDETARGNLGELFEDHTGEDSTPVHVLKSAGKGLVSSVAHGAVGVEKGIVGGTLDTLSAGARALGGEKLADDLQRAKRFNDEMMDLKPLDDALLGDDPGRAAWDAMMGVSEGLGGIYGGIKAAVPLAAGLKGAKVAKTAEGAMKGAFTAQMAAGGEEAARTAILTKKDEQGRPVVDENGQPVIENRDLTWRERAEVGYHTLKEGITAQFFGRIVGAWGEKIGNAGAAALEFGGINAAGVLADAYIGDSIAGRPWKDEDGNILTGNEKDMAVLAKAGAAFAYGGMQSLLMSMGGGIVKSAASQPLNGEMVKSPPSAALNGAERFNNLKGGEAADLNAEGGLTEALAAARKKAAAAMVQAAADPESAAVAARGANGETLMKNGALVRVAEDGATEIVTPDGVVLDAEGNVKTVAAGNVGETGEGSYGTAIAVRTNPLTGQPTAARETVRNALVALQEGVTIDQLREIDGWTPENKAVFEIVKWLKGEKVKSLEEGAQEPFNPLTFQPFNPHELVDAYARLGLGVDELRAFGLMANEDAAMVAVNGTRQLADAAGGEVPLDIAAEVARSVNAGTTGLMPEELGKRQMETARQIVAERAKAALEESAAGHGNTPEAERAVLDTPVEQPDGTLQPLSRLEEVKGLNGEKVKSLDEGADEPFNPLTFQPFNPKGTANTLRARHEREQSVKALGLKPLGDGSYGVGRFPQMRVEKADGVADDSGRPVSAIHVTGLDPAEMLRPENILDMARVLGDLMEKCADKGVRVDFEPEAMDAVNEVMAKWETDVRTDPVLRARSEVVTSLLEKSGLASGIVTDQAAFEAALREKGGDKAEKLIVDGLTYGFTDGDKVYLNPAFFGTKTGLNTPIHEFGHLGIIACRKINRPLYDRGIDLIKQTKYWQEVTEHPDYKNDDPVKNAEEALTRLIADRGEKLSAETPKGVLAEIKQWLVDFWKTFGNALGLRDITPEQVEKMTVEQIADAIRAEMLRGEKFGTSRAQVEAQRQGGRRLKAGQRKRSPQSYIEAGGGKASKAFAFWAENGRRIMNVPKPGEFGWDIYNQLVLGVKDPAERARIKRILCGDQPKNTRKKGNDEILAEFNRTMGGDGDIYTDESGFQQMVEEFLSSHADYERWRAEGAKSAEEMEAEVKGLKDEKVKSLEDGAQEPFNLLNIQSFNPQELEEWSRMYDESRMAMAEAGLADEPDARVPDDAMWSRGGKLRFSIGGIYTGSAADYANRSREGGKDDGPSLKHIGSGEGSQVYGWGLYGSTVRGVAENYSREKKARGIKSEKRGKTSAQMDEAEGLAAYYFEQNNGDIGAAIRELREYIKNDKDNEKLVKSLTGAVKELEEHGGEYEMLHENLYEQTFFTNREPGDESHLLKWYEEVSDENWDRIIQQADKEGMPERFEANKIWLNFKEDFQHYITDLGNSGESVYQMLSKFLGSPQAASEFLARAGIDGVKYPVDSYGGKSVKDGDKAGWNYVAFSDEHIRVDHKWTDGELRFSIAVTPEMRRDTTVNATDMTREKADAALRALAGRNLVNDETKIVAQVNSVQRRKILSNAAVRKSQDNGFSVNEHDAAASILEKLWKFATLGQTNPDKNGDPALKSVKRFVAPVRLGDRDAYAYITAKESVEHGHRIYSIELEKLEALAGMFKERTPRAANASDVPEGTEDNIANPDGEGNGEIRLSRGGYRPGDWRKTFTFGKAARSETERTPGGEAAGEERRRWEENPTDERIPEWDAPGRNPNIAKPFALSAAEGYRILKALGGEFRKTAALKDVLGVIDASDEAAIREDLRGMGFFKGDDILWAATATPAEVAADRADSQAALDARLEKLGDQRLKGEAGGGNRGAVRVMMSQVADLALKLPAETGGNLGNVRTLAQGIVRGFEKDRDAGQMAYYLQEAKNLLDWFYGGGESLKGEKVKSLEGGEQKTFNPLTVKPFKLLARAFGAWLEAPDAVAEHAPGLYREFVDAVARNAKLSAAFDAIRRTALGEGSASRVYAEIEQSRTVAAEAAAARLEDEARKPFGTRWEKLKDSFVYNFDDMHGPIFMHIDRAQKRQLQELSASLKAGRITQADYDAVAGAFERAVKGLKIAQLTVDRGWQNEIRQYLWDMGRLFEEAKAAGVDPKNVQRYMDLRWIVSSGGRAGARGMSARDAQIVLDNMERQMGAEEFARLEGVAARFHAVREKNLLDDPRLVAMIGQDRVNYFKNNVHYVRTERLRATPEELARMEADRAQFRRDNPGDDDVTAAMLKLLAKTGGRGGGAGNSTWGHALEGSTRDVGDRFAATWRNDTRLIAAIERNDFVLQMRDALLAAKTPGVRDLPGSKGVQYPQNERYGHIRYFDGGQARVLVVPRVLADGYRQVSDSMNGWSAWGKIAHGVFIDWNLAYTLRNMTRNMASNESNIVGMRADNLTIAGNALLPGAGRAASMASYQIARHLPEWVFNNPLARVVYGEHVNAAYARQAQRILELYLDPKKAVERQAQAEEARLRSDSGPAAELAADLDMLRFVTKGNALIAGWNQVRGLGRDADDFMRSHGLGSVYGESAPQAPASRARKILARAGDFLSYPFRRNARFNRDLELHAKITAALAIHDLQPGLSAQEVGVEVARRASIPQSERRGAQAKFIGFAWNMFFNTALKSGERFVGNVARNPRLLGKMAAQSLGPQLFWATMIAGGGLTAVIRNMFGGGDDAEEKAREAGLGGLLDYAQFMHNGAFAASPYLQRFYHWCPLWEIPGGRYLGIATPRTDEEKMLLPFVDWAAKLLAPQPTDPTETLVNAVKRAGLGVFVPNMAARTPLVAAAQDIVQAWWDNPFDTYRGTHVYGRDLWNARLASGVDAAEFFGATLKQGLNDLGGRSLLASKRNEIDVAGAQPPTWGERMLHEIPGLSGVLAGTLRMTLTKEQRKDQIREEVLRQVRSVKNKRAEDLKQMMLEDPVANIGIETPEMTEKLDAWAAKYGWDQDERDNVFARAFNGYQAATAAGQELAAQKNEKNRRVRYNKMPNSEKKAVEAAGLREILAE